MSKSDLAGKESNLSTFYSLPLDVLFRYFQENEGIVIEYNMTSNIITMRNEQGKIFKDFASRFTLVKEVEEVKHGSQYKGQKSEGKYRFFMDLFLILGSIPFLRYFGIRSEFQCFSLIKFYKWLHSFIIFVI